MGCSASKSKSTPQERAHDYQRESRRFLRNAKLQPSVLSPEHFRGGYISSYQFYNYFHAGFCAPYICNPNYMLIVDFRTSEEYMQGHILTAEHHSSRRWDMSTIKDLEKYSYVVFYDHDGTAAANIYSNISSITNNLTAARIEVMCILGGMNRLESRFPHLISSTKKIKADEDDNKCNGKFSREAATVPWMPSSILASSIFLGNLEQARNPKVIKTLGITHVISIGRSPDWKSKNVRYIPLDGDRNLYLTFLAASEFIQSALEKEGKVLVHGVEGINRSAAVIMAFLMSNTTSQLEDVFLYIKSLRPHLNIDNESLACLLRWEASLFGFQLTDPDDLWI